MEKYHLTCISKVLTDLCCTKQRMKKKNTFAKAVYIVLVVNVLTEHKKVCLSINCAQSARLEKGTSMFKNYFKQIPVPFKIYADFECKLGSPESYEGSYLKVSRSRSL